MLVLVFLPKPKHRRRQAQLPGRPFHRIRVCRLSAARRRTSRTVVSATPRAETERRRVREV